MQAENVEEEENESEERVAYSQMDYDPNTSEKIVCVELANNQQIFIEYKSGWTIRNLISEVITRKEYQLLHQNRNMILSSLYHPDIFDLNLCFYDTIMPDHENRVAEYITLEKLHELHMLKNYRAPFFVIRENFTPDSYIYSNNYKLDQMKEIKDSNFNYYAMYMDYMPKMIKWNINLLIAHPEIEDYFIRNKRGYNEFAPFKRNILTCDKKTIDWFIYDKESIKFLLEMEKLEFMENSNLKYINGKIYFEDKFDEEMINMNNGSVKKRRFSFTKKLTDKELSNFFINLKIDLSTDDNKKNIQTHKFKINSTTTAYDLIEKLSIKISHSTLNTKYEPQKKILKVLSLNDYIFDVNQPLINFQYINECVKLNKTAEYLVIDNPSLLERANSNNSAGKIPSSYTSNNTTLDSNASSEINLSSLGSFQKAKSGGKYNLRNIAVYNPTLNNYTGDIMNPSMVLEKGINFGMNDKPGVSNNNYTQNNHNTRTRKSNAFTGTRRSSQNTGLSENTIEEFINLLNNEIEKELENQLKNGDIIQTKKEEEKNKY